MARVRAAYEQSLICMVWVCGPACAERGLAKAGGRRWRRASGAAGAALIKVQKGYSANRELHAAQVR